MNTTAKANPTPIATKNPKTILDRLNLLFIDAPWRLKFGGTLSKQVKSALIERLPIDAITALDGEIWVKPHTDTAFRLSYTLSAKITQSCVISGEPVESALESESARDLIVEEDPHDENPSEVWELTSGEDPDYLPEGELALIDVVVDALLLEIDAYPRAEGATDVAALPEGVEFNAPPQKPANPFAALAALKKD